MNEKPLERLNYYNGQRLEAADFKTEQDYHIRTKRWLNKSLYSAGIARGLDVRPITEGPKKDTPFVTVGPGLALDNEGREIILLEEATVEVYSYAGTDESTVVGNYLVIEYAEETIAYEKGGCAVRAEGTSANKSTTNWGGPSRIQARVKFSWVPFAPQPGSNQIVLARVELKVGCIEVNQIDTGARRYIGAASAATVRQYALEGEREVAALPPSIANDPAITVNGTLYFHIRRQPSAVTLYLKTSEFSKLHYTELGNHEHDLDLELSKLPIAPHAHDLPTLTTDDGPAKGIHRHNVTAITADCDDSVWSTLIGVLINIPALSVAFDPSGYRALTLTPLITTVADADGNTHAINMSHAGLDIRRTNFVDMKITLDEANDAGPHSHTISKSPLNKTDDFPKVNQPPLSYTLTFDSKNLGSAGVLDASANKQYSGRKRKPLAFLGDLKIAIDRVDRTKAIRDQIVDSVADVDQKRAWEEGLGNGTSTHPLANEEVEAVPIRLDFLPHVAFTEGQHVIEFSVGLTPGGEANGGKILYNLYIE